MSRGLRRRRGKRWGNFSTRVQNLVRGESFGLHGVFKTILRLSLTHFSLQCRTLLWHRFRSPCTSLTMKTHRSRYHRVAIGVWMIHIYTDGLRSRRAMVSKMHKTKTVTCWKTRPNTGRKIVRINFFSPPFVHLPLRTGIVVVFPRTHLELPLLKNPNTRNAEETERIGCFPVPKNTLDRCCRDTES